jgi:hypothetical protein
MRLTPAFVLFTVAAAHAQTTQPGRAALPSDSVPMTIQLAEAEGTRFPVSTGPDSSQFTVRARRSTGTSEHKCVEASASMFVRSGDFTVAGFGAYGPSWHTGWGKLNWFPDHPSPASPAELVVRAARLDESAPPWIFERRGGLAHAVGAMADFSYPSGFILPTVGRWMLVARAGANWGCFIYQLS